MPKGTENTKNQEAEKQAERTDFVKLASSRVSNALAALETVRKLAVSPKYGPHVTDGDRDKVTETLMTKVEAIAVAWTPGKAPETDDRFSL